MTKTKQKPELLAPAGSLDKAKIAFLYGADAVYAGTSKTSLRTRTNMVQDELKDIADYAHSIDKKVYAAVNIYAYDENYDTIEEELTRLKDMNIDALIISDGGILNLAKKIAPNIPIHISTQANTTSLRSANFWKDLGASRIILSRELSKDKIKYIMENKSKDLEIEMFIHGAICFAYSGRCYLSQYLSDRSANCGDCSQPCRWEYKLQAEEVNTPGSFVNVDFDEKGTYIFSSKDLCLINRIPEIIEMKIDSLKIEGRLKTDYYLATVVRAYRMAIDDYIENSKGFNSDKYLRELKKVKTRGMSEFYYADSKNQDIHDFDGFSENLDYQYAGKVIKKEETLGDNVYLIEIRNKLIVGDELEAIIPNKENFKFNIKVLKDVETKENIEYINPGKQGQSVYMEIPYELKERYILRKKK